jgi:hypothetical protein
MTFFALFRHWFRRDDQVSSDWLKAHGRTEQRIDFHSAPIRFPICKVKNEHPLWNTHKLRKVG